MLGIWKKALVALLALVMLSVGGASASAEERPDGGGGLKAVTQEVEAQALDAAANPLAHLAGGAALDDRSALVAESADGSHYVVSAGLTGSKVDEGSYVAVVLSRGSLEVAQVIQVNIDILDAQSADVNIWIDGELFDEQHVTVDDAASEGTVTTQASRQDIIDCFAAAGVGVVAATAIVATCGAICAVTVGAGCIACAAGFSVLAGAYAGRCFNQG